MNIDNLTKTFTRFFVPGLILVLVGILLPVFIVWGINPKEYKDVLTAGNILLASVLSGYVLDSIRGYRLTFAYFEYKSSATKLQNNLQEITGLEDANPDQHIADLWVHDKETYERLLQERAEWVMILETSFSLVISSFLTAIFTLLRWENINSEKAIILVCVILTLIISSYVSSKNGITRMESHDRKMIQALKNLKKTLSNTVK